MRRVLYIVVFIGCLLGGLLWGMPLSFALKQAGLTDTGVSWVEARGTLARGQLVGISYDGEALGAANIHVSPLGLLTGNRGADIVWRGPVGQGRATVSGTPNRFAADTVALQIDLARLSRINPALERLSGMAQLSGGSLTIQDGICASAAGTVSTDALTRLGAPRGFVWPQLSGPLGCDNGHIVLPLQGRGADGEVFRIELIAEPAGAMAITASVDNADARTAQVFALLERGWRVETDGTLQPDTQQGDSQ